MGTIVSEATVCFWPRNKISAHVKTLIDTHLHVLPFELKVLREYMWVPLTAIQPSLEPLVHLPSPQMRKQRCREKEVQWEQWRQIPQTGPGALQSSIVQCPRGRAFQEARGDLGCLLNTRL